MNEDIPKPILLTLQQAYEHVAQAGVKMRAFTSTNVPTGKHNKEIESTAGSVTYVKFSNKPPAP